MKICPACKTENLESAMFCVHCGERLPAETTEQPEAVYPAEEKPAVTDAHAGPAESPVILPTSEGRPVVVPSLENQMPPQVVAAAESGELTAEEPIPPADIADGVTGENPELPPLTMEEVEEQRKDMQAGNPLPPY